MERQKIIIISLSVVFFFSLQYFVLDRWLEAVRQEETRSYQEGYANGLRNAVGSIMQQTDGCHLAKISIGNFSKEVFDFSCLKNFTNP